MRGGDLGKLTVRLGLQDRQFQRQLQSGETRLAAFGRRISIMGIAAGTAAAAGLTALTVQSLSAIDATAKLARDLGTTTASLQVVERAGELAGVSMSGIAQATKDMTRRLSQAADGGGPAADALRRLGLSAQDLMAMPLDQRLRTINGAMEDFVPAAARAAVAGQIFGEEGSIAIGRLNNATLDQALDDIERFGVAVSDVDARQIERTNDAMSRLSLIGEGLGNRLSVAVAPALERMANAMAQIFQVGSPVSRVLEGLAANLDRVVFYAGAAAAAFGVRYVGGIVAATAMTANLAGAMRVLRAAIIRTGIGALVVGVGELALRFSRLVEFTGSVGDALDLLKTVAASAFRKVGWALQSMYLRWRAMIQGTQALFLGALADMAAGMTSWVNTIVGGFSAGFAGMREVWRNLPSVLGDFMFQAADRILSAISDMINQAADGINFLIRSLRGIPGLPIVIPPIVGEVELSVSNPFAGSAAQTGADIGAAMNAEMNREFISGDNAVVNTLRSAADEAQTMARLTAAAADGLSNAARGPIDGLEELRTAISATSEDAETLTDEMVDLTDGLEDVGGGPGGGAAPGGAAAAVSGLEDVADAAQTLAQRLQPIENAASSLFDGLTDRTQKSRDVLARFVDDLRRMATNSLFQGFWRGFGNGGGGILGLLGGAASGPAAAAPSFSGGGRTPNIPRVGGIDGIGGFPAVLHGNETVIDHTKGGGMAVAEVRLGPGLVASMLQQSAGQSIAITQAADAASQKAAQGRFDNMVERQF